MIGGGGMAPCPPWIRHCSEPGTSSNDVAIAVSGGSYYANKITQKVAYVML